VCRTWEQVLGTWARVLAHRNGVLLSAGACLLVEYGGGMDVGLVKKCLQWGWSRITNNSHIWKLWITAACMRYDCIIGFDKD
jgi:hypothetical protein